MLSRVYLSGSVGVDVCCLFPATNLTAGTVYEVAVWAHTSVGDSPTTLTHQQTKGQLPERPLLKAKAVNQTAVECSWTVSGSPAQVNTNNIIENDVRDCCFIFDFIREIQQLKRF